MIDKGGERFIDFYVKKKKRKKLRAPSHTNGSRMIQGLFFFNWST